MRSSKEVPDGAVDPGGRGEVIPFNESGLHDVLLVFCFAVLQSLFSKEKVLHRGKRCHNLSAF